MFCLMRISPRCFGDTWKLRGYHGRKRSPLPARRFAHVQEILAGDDGSGVALFDYDNDGRLDIFLVNGAPLTDPTPKGTIPQKAGPAHWNRLFHQKSDGTFEDVTEKAGLTGDRNTSCRASS